MKKITLVVLISGLLASQFSFGAAKPVSSRFDPRNQAIAWGLTLSGTKTHVKRLWLRKTKGSGEDPLVC